jgi:uncharacterized protein with HEPN domain
MSTRDARAYLHDIARACEGIAAVIGEVDEKAYRADLKTRLATERELITIGEAAARIREVEPNAGDDWPVPLGAVVGLRNVLVHGYFSVDDDRVYEIASEQVPMLHAVIVHALERAR